MSGAQPKAISISIGATMDDRGITADVGGTRFYWKPKAILGADFSDLGRTSPTDVGFFSSAPDEVLEAVAKAPGVEIETPDNELAALNWEALSEGTVVRRYPLRHSEHIYRPTFPIRMMILTPNEQDAQSVFDSMPDIVKEEVKVGRLIIDTRPIDRFNDIAAALGSHYYDVVHLSVPTTTRGKLAEAMLGGEPISLKGIVAQAVAKGPRLAFLHAETEDIFGGISALRMESRAADLSGTTIVMQSAPSAETAAKDFMSKVYRDAFAEDAPLISRSVAPQIQVSPILATGIAAPLNRASYLGLGRTLTRRRAVMSEDVKRAVQFLPANTKFIGFLDTFASPKGAGPRAPSSFLSDLFDVANTGKEIEKANKGGRDIKDAENRDRFPIGNFYYCGGDTPTEWEAIPENHTLCESTDGGNLEFHFWIDPVRGGIRILDLGSFGPKNAVYPLILKAHIWTESRTLEFANVDSELEIPEFGASSHARFRLKEFPESGDVEFFLFLLAPNGSMVAAFQAKARFRQTAEIDEQAQLLFQLYSSSDYFHFSESPTSSAMTILFDKGTEGLRVFTLTAKGRPWAKLGIPESSVMDSNRDLYKNVTRLALDAAARERAGQPARISTDSMRKLADGGYVLLQDIFKVSAAKGARDFIDRVFELEPGSRITIATTESAAGFLVPWSLLYLKNDYREFPFPVHREAFLGYRYNVVVRPSIPSKTTPPSDGPARIATAWLTRPETGALKDMLDTAQTAGRISYTPVKAIEGYLPSLSDEFDLIHFYCHGHTRFPNEFHPEEFLKIFEASIPTASTNASSATTELQQFLQKVSSATDSLMQLDGGFVYRSDLASKLDDFPRAPIVLLSMCESAQVTSYGAGFVSLFLNRGARAAMGTEGPTLWSLGRDLDLAVITRLMNGETIGDAFYAAKKDMADQNPLALIYSLWGDRDARIPVAK
jgi:hypothetical protein